MSHGGALRKLLAFVAIAAATNVAIVASLPWLINAFVLYKVAQLAGGDNVALHAPRPDASARGIVRPSPDLLYTACAFDVSERPLRITAPVQDSYVSVSGFAADTTNFFAINDASLAPAADGTKHFDIVVARAAPADVPPGATVVIAPSSRGLILFRSLIGDDASLARLKDGFQARQECAPVE